MKKITIACILLSSLLSCKDDNDIIRLRAIDENFRKNNILIENENKAIIDKMNDKVKLPESRYKAMIWQPKAEAVKELSIAMNGYIDSLKTSLKREAGLKVGDAKEVYTESNTKSVSLIFENQNRTSELFKRLTTFKQAIISTIQPDEFSDNPLMRENLIRKRNEFETSLVTDIKPDTLNRNVNPVSTYFQNNSALGAIVMLNKIQNDVLQAENRMLNYFNSETVSYHDLVYETFSALVTRNSNYFKIGETLEIYAGLGSFSVASRPKFTINEKVIPVDDDGVATYKLKISNKPGKYFIPVKIEFVKPDGSNAIKVEKIDYTIIP